MVALTTFPPMDAMWQQLGTFQEYMHPNTIPLAVIAEGLISPEHCEEIARAIEIEQPYSYPKCGAQTRETALIEVLEPIDEFTRQMNDLFWEYDLDEEPMTWMQTYSVGSDYDKHADQIPGVMRKLTAVTLLSSPRDYGAGHLILEYYPKTLEVPRTQGTTVIFQATVFHWVTPVTSGMRRTTNMGFYGPPFK